MSCDYTKLCYLEETKRIFREKIDPQGEKITDETPFREYAKLIEGRYVGDAALLTDVVPLEMVTFGTATYTAFEEV